MQRVEGPASNGLLRWLTEAPSEMSPRSALVIKLSVQSKSAPATSAESSEVTLFGNRPEQLADPGFGTIRLFWPEAASGAEEQPFLDAIKQTQQIAHRYGGSAVVEQCPLPIKENVDVWGDAPDSLAIMQRIKEKFDPAGILNPGRFLGGI